MSSTNVSSLLLDESALRLDYRNVLGEGSFGVVYRGDFEGTDVAVKALHRETLQAKTQFHREIRRYSALQHPNICQFFGLARAQSYNLTTGELLLVTELCTGGSVFAAIRNIKQTQPVPAALPIQTLHTIAYSAANALVYLHAHGYCHGDLKTQNLLLTYPIDLDTGNLHPASRVKLCDFGVSRRLQSSATSPLYRTATNSTSLKRLPTVFTDRGSYPYLSPEAFSIISDNDPDILKAADIYALGVILYELITLQVPWQGLSSWDVFRMVVKNGSRPPWPQYVSIDKKWINLVERCWNTDPCSRPTAEQVSDEIMQINLEMCDRDRAVTSSALVPLPNCSFTSSQDISTSSSPVTKLLDDGDSDTLRISGSCGRAASLSHDESQHEASDSPDRDHNNDFHAEKYCSLFSSIEDDSHATRQVSLGDSSWAEPAIAHDLSLDTGKDSGGSTTVQCDDAASGNPLEVTSSMYSQHGADCSSSIRHPIDADVLAPSERDQTLTEDELENILNDFSLHNDQILWATDYLQDM